MTKQEYQIYLHSEHWLKFRKMVYKFKKTCKNCGSREKLNIHHVSYENLGNERLRDIMVLCNLCHHAHHKGLITVFKDKTKKEQRKHDKIMRLRSKMDMSWLYNPRG